MLKKILKNFQKMMRYSCKIMRSVLYYKSIRDGCAFVSPLRFINKILRLRYIVSVA